MQTFVFVEMTIITMQCGSIVIVCYLLMQCNVTITKIKTNCTRDTQFRRLKNYKSAVKNFQDVN